MPFSSLGVSREPTTSHSGPRTRRLSKFPATAHCSEDIQGLLRLWNRAVALDNIGVVHLRSEG